MVVGLVCMLVDCWGGLVCWLGGCWVGMLVRLVVVLGWYVGCWVGVLVVGLVCWSCRLVVRDDLQKSWIMERLVNCLVV